MKKKLLLIDTFNFLHRAYHAIPKTFRDKEGNPTNAIYGVTSMLINVLSQISPNYVIAALDSKEPTFRVEDFTGYKAHRKELDYELESQIQPVIDIIGAFGINALQVNGYEADDIIGTAVKMFAGKDLDIIIISNDRDMWQLIGENVIVASPTNGNQLDWIGTAEVEKRLGFAPKLLIDYKALRGDTSDNIPGVHGIGEKTATKLIQEFGNVEELYRNIAKVEPASLREKLANNAEEAVMSKHLATIVSDVPMGLNLSDCKYDQFNREALKDALTRYNFKSLLRRLGFEADTGKKETPNEDQLQLL